MQKSSRTSCTGFVFLNCLAGCAASGVVAFASADVGAGAVGAAAVVVELSLAEAEGPTTRSARVPSAERRQQRDSSTRAARRKEGRGQRGNMVLRIVSKRIWRQRHSCIQGHCEFNSNNSGCGRLRQRSRVLHSRSLLAPRCQLLCSFSRIRSHTGCQHGASQCWISQSFLSLLEQNTSRATHGEEQ